MDKTIADYVKGEWRLYGHTDRPDRANFVIVTPTGDWSGLKTLKECLTQTMPQDKPNNYYQVVERL